MKSLSSPDSTVFLILKILCLFKISVEDPWDFLVSTLRRNSFKSALLILSPEKAGKLKAKEWLRIITDSALIEKAARKGGVFAILMEYILWWLRISIGYEKFERHRVERERLNQTANEGMKNREELASKFFSYLFSTFK